MFERRRCTDLHLRGVRHTGICTRAECDSRVDGCRDVRSARRVPSPVRTGRRYRVQSMAHIAGVVDGLDGRIGRRVGRERDAAQR